MITFSVEFGSSCLLTWSSTCAKCCMFPWFILFFMSTFIVVANTDPDAFSFTEGICYLPAYGVNATNSTNVTAAPNSPPTVPTLMPTSAPTPEDLSHLSLDFTFAVNYLTWITIGIFVAFTASFTAWDKYQKRKENGLPNIGN